MFISPTLYPLGYMNQLLNRRIGLEYQNAALLNSMARQTVAKHVKAGKMEAFYISPGVVRVLNTGHNSNMPEWLPIAHEVVATLLDCSRSHIAALVTKEEGDPFRLNRSGEGDKVTYADVMDFIDRNRIRIQAA